MSTERGKGFWSDKVPCWELRGCEGKQGGAPDCPACRKQQYPCWELKDTVCKGETGCDVYFCSLCKVYSKYGKGKPLPSENDLK